jgi:hypothetical protein
VLELSEVKHLANLCDGGIKNNEVFGWPSFVCPVVLELGLRLIHFLHQII